VTLCRWILELNVSKDYNPIIIEHQEFREKNLGHLDAEEWILDRTAAESWNIERHCVLLKKLAKF
jgi:hypothetical protein